MNPLAILGLLLALSVAGNAVLGRAYVIAREGRATATAAREQAQGAATACSAGVDALAETARLRGMAAARELDAARIMADRHRARADQVLLAPATAPADDCRSARERADAWLAGRAAP
jgi:hypothetical protein